jgi:hypothetical protein
MTDFLATFAPALILAGVIVVAGVLVNWVCTGCWVQDDDKDPQ